MEEQPQTITTESSTNKYKQNSFVIILLSVLLIVSCIFVGFFAWQTQKLNKILINKNTKQIVQNQSSKELQFSDLYNKIEDKGSISGSKTVNTDDWTKKEDTIVENRKINYSFDYPRDLYVVKNVRGDDVNDIYFFQNTESYKKYVACLNDKTPLEGSDDVVTRDWEGGCDIEGNLLFKVYVSLYNLYDFLAGYDPSKLVYFSDPTNVIKWIVPREGNMFGGLMGEEYAIGHIRSLNRYIHIDMIYPFDDESKNRIKEFTGLDTYQLLIHIISTFKVSE